MKIMVEKNENQLIEHFIRNKLLNMEQFCRQCFNARRDIFSFLNSIESVPYTKGKLIRLENNKDSIRGILIFNSKIIGFTLEDPNLFIPQGVYCCFIRWSEKFQTNLYGIDVPERTHIEIHWGNTEDDTTGCIIIGERIGTLNGKNAVLNSKRIFDKFMELTNKEEFYLTILEI